MSVYHFNFEEDLEDYETEWKQYVKHTELKSELLQVLKRETDCDSCQLSAERILIWYIRGEAALGRNDHKHWNEFQESLTWVH